MVNGSNATVTNNATAVEGSKFKVNLMLVFEDREAYHIRKTFMSNGGFRQTYLRLPTDTTRRVD